MYKIIINSILIIYMCFALSCNANAYYPINVTFKNGTVPGSYKYVVSAVFLEDKRIRDKYTDIFISLNLDETNLTVSKEPTEPVEIFIIEKNKWYSLTELMNQNPKADFSTFAKAQTTTYIIRSKTPVNLKFKAVGGDLNEDNSALTNVFKVSNIFEVEIAKVEGESG